MGRTVAPAATAYNADRPRRGTKGRGASSYCISPPIPAPLPYVAAHVVKIKGILGLFLYLVGLSSAVVTIPCDASYCVASTVGGLVGVAGVAPTRKVFPLRLSWQAVAVGCKVAGYGSAYNVVVVGSIVPLACVCISVHLIAGSPSVCNASLVAVHYGIVPAYIFHRIV